MSKYIESISDFQLHDGKTHQQFNTVLNTEKMPFGSNMIIAFVFVNIKPSKDYTFKVYLNDHLISLTNANIPSDNLMFRTELNNEIYGLVGGEVDFSLALEEFGAFEIRCDLTHENEVLHTLKKIYLMTKSEK